VGDYSRLDSPRARIQDGDPDDLRARKLLLPGRLSSRGRRFYELKYVRLKIVPKEHAILAGGRRHAAGEAAVFTAPGALGLSGLWAGQKVRT
jgi:hypothetical protein